MDIQTALNELSGFFDMLYETGFLSPDEKDTLCEVEDAIIQFVNERS